MRTQAKLRAKIKSVKVKWKVERKRKTGSYDPTTATSIKTSFKKKKKKNFAWSDVLPHTEATWPIEIRMPRL